MCVAIGWHFMVHAVHYIVCVPCMYIYLRVHNTHPYSGYIHIFSSYSIQVLPQLSEEDGVQKAL